MDRTEMKNEALRRMKELGIMREVIEQFKKDNIVHYSERMNKQFNAVLYWLSNEKEYVDKVKEFENRTGSLVYHCILTHTEYGDILDMLHVSRYKEEWDYEIEKGSRGYRVFSNACNLTDEFMSDRGSIMVRPAMGGLERLM